jgi:hypothetical protein
VLGSASTTYGDTSSSTSFNIGKLFVWVR